jgi:hypothetical protein
MISCKEVTRLVSEGYDRRLGLVERWRLRAHLRVCKACPRFVAQMEFLARTLSEYRHGPRGMR